MRPKLHEVYKDYWTPDYWKGYIEQDTPAKLYRNSRDFALISELLCPTDGEFILDAGCGYGRISKVILDSTSTAKVVGVDISSSMISYASNWLGSRFEGQLSDLQSLPFSDGIFNSVICNGVIMHVQDEKAVIQELTRVLQPGGRLVLSVNNLLSLFSLPTMFYTKIVKRGRMKQTFRSPRYYSKALLDAGIQVTKVAADTIFVVDIALPYLAKLGVNLPPRWVLPLIKFPDRFINNLTYLGYELYFLGIKEGADSSNS